MVLRKTLSGEVGEATAVERCLLLEEEATQGTMLKIEPAELARALALLLRLELSLSLKF